MATTQPYFQNTLPLLVGGLETASQTAFFQTTIRNLVNAMNPERSYFQLFMDRVGYLEVSLLAVADCTFSVIVFAGTGAAYLTLETVAIPFGGLCPQLQLLAHQTRYFALKYFTKTFLSASIFVTSNISILTPTIGAIIQGIVSSIFMGVASRAFASDLTGNIQRLYYVWRERFFALYPEDQQANASALRQSLDRAIDTLEHPSAIFSIFAENQELLPQIDGDISQIFTNMEFAEAQARCEAGKNLLLAALRTELNLLKGEAQKTFSDDVETSTNLEEVIDVLIRYCIQNDVDPEVHFFSDKRVELNRLKKTYSDFSDQNKEALLSAIRSQNTNRPEGDEFDTAWENYVTLKGHLLQSNTDFNVALQAAQNELFLQN